MIFNIKCRLMEIESCVIIKLHIFLVRISKKLVRKHTKIYKKYVAEYCDNDILATKAAMEEIEKIEKKNEGKK